jgi:catechol 2,3-dioxygenase-like lactoylglutathione lyase family enzyme
MFLTKIHIRLGVTDVERSVTFYSALLSAPPTDHRPATALFDLDSPPLVLTVQHQTRERRQTGQRGLRPQGQGTTRDAKVEFCPHSRFVLIVNDPRQIGDTCIALRRAGVPLRLEDQGIDVADPDQNSWRVRFVPSARGRIVVAA